MRLSCIQFPFRVAAKCTTCRCVTYIGWLSRKRLISNLPACRGSILGDPDIQKPSPSLPPLPPHPPCITTASTSAFTSAASHHPFASSFMLPTAPTSFIRTDTTTTPRRHAGSRLFRDFLADSRADRASPLHRSSCIAYRPSLPPSLSPLLHPPLIHPWRIYHGRIEIGRYVRPFDVRAFHAKQMVQHRGRTIFDLR